MTQEPNEQQPENFETVDHCADRLANFAQALETLERELGWNPDAFNYGTFKERVEYATRVATAHEREPRLHLASGQKSAIAEALKALRATMPKI